MWSSKKTPLTKGWNDHRRFIITSKKLQLETELTMSSELSDRTLRPRTSKRKSWSDEDDSVLGVDLLIFEFESGVLKDCPNGTTLKTYLSSKLELTNSTIAELIHQGVDFNVRLFIVPISLLRLFRCPTVTLETHPLPPHRLHLAALPAPDEGSSLSMLSLLRHLWQPTEGLPPLPPRLRAAHCLYCLLVTPTSSTTGSPLRMSQMTVHCSICLV